MNTNQDYDVVIIGGSAAGLSAALALGRALRRVLVIDAGQPCNRFAVHSHNFLTQDGVPPSQILAQGRQQLTTYETVTLVTDEVVEVRRDQGFVVRTSGGLEVTAARLILATGIRDQIPSIPGFAECWGKTVVHCPYCHGYEVRGQKTGIWAGEGLVDRVKLVGQWSRDLVVIAPEGLLEADQRTWLAHRGVPLVEGALEALEHREGRLSAAVVGGQRVSLEVLYARLPWSLPPVVADLGCTLKAGLVEVDAMLKTSVPGVWACGDAVTPMRSISNAVAQGGMAGAVVNHDLCAEG